MHVCVCVHVHVRVGRCRLPLRLLITAHAITTIATTYEMANTKSLTIAAAVARNLLLNRQTFGRPTACRTDRAELPS